MFQEERREKCKVKAGGEVKREEKRKKKRINEGRNKEVKES